MCYNVGKEQKYFTIGTKWKIQRKMKLNLRFFGIYIHLLVRQRKKEEDGRGRTRRRGSEADGQDQKSSWFGG